MDCSKVQLELVAYLDGELGESEAAVVRHHLERCPACKLEAQRLSAAGELLDEFGEIEPSKDFTARTMQRALSLPEPAVSRPRILRRLLPAAVAAAVLVTLTLWLVVPLEPETLTPVEQEIVKNMDVLENLELLEDMDMLGEMDLLLEYEEEDFESS